MNPITETDVLAPFEIWEVPFDDGATIKFHEPLLLAPFWHDSDQGSCYLGVEDPDLDISAFGADREELWRCIRGEIRFVWRRCVRQDDEKLSPQHRKLKANYLAIAEEIEDKEVADE